MIEELQEKCEALAIRKREELEHSLEQDLVADPISILISVAISTALAGASYAIAYLARPKTPRQQQGKLTGSIQLQNSEQGIFIPEIYGGSPTTSLTTGSNPTYQNVTNATGGGSGSITKTSGSTAWNAGASHNVAITSGQDAFFEFILGTGYATAGFTLTASPVNGNTDFLFAPQWNPDGSVTIKYNGTQQLAAVTTWVTGDKFRVELRSGRFRLFKGSAEIFPQGMIVPTPSYPLYMGIAMFTTGAGISNGKVQIGSIGPTPNSGRGGIKVPAIIVWSSGIRKVVTTTQVQTGGGKGGGHSQTVDNITYNIDLGLMFSRGPVNLIREYANADILIDQFAQSPNPSGVYDPGVGADSTYDPLAPPDPSLHYLTPVQRVDGDISVDGFGVGTGNVQGGGSGFAIYPGNTTQQPDPTIEADIDGKYGSGSTPAYRNHSLIVHNTLQLSRWGGVVPNVTAVWEHQTLKTLDLIFASMCERVGVLTANGDYDFSGIAIESRGLLVSGRPFQPAEVIGSPDLELAYNYFVTEKEGQIVGYAEGSEPSITIPDTEIGWLEGDGELPDILPEVDSVIAPEISLPREVHVKSLDPDFDWEPNTQSAMRQITDGSKVELLEIQITQLADERRATAQRKLYRDYVAGTAHKFTLSWTYLFLHTGYKITITRAEGFSHVLRLTSVTGGIGVLECEGIALEPETFTQPANGVFPPGYIPPQPIPAMTIAVLLDTPLLRDSDNAVNGGVGFYAGGVPRTGVDQNWQGFALYISRNGQWQVLGSSELPATIGTIISTASMGTDPSIIDTTGIITIDLYGTTATLSSMTEADANMDSEKNLAVVGNEVIRFLTATQVAGFPNRWQLSNLLHGRRGTINHIGETLTNKRFVLIDGAIKFVPMDINDLNGTADYRAVTNGQSLGDSATISFTWTGGGARPLAPTGLTGARDQPTTPTSGSDLLIRWVSASRIASGLRSNTGLPLAEEQERYEVEIYSGSTLKRTMKVEMGTRLASFFIPDKAFNVSNGLYAFHNGMGPEDPSPFNLTARTAQDIPIPGNTFEGGLRQAGGPTGSIAMLGLGKFGGTWQGLADTIAPLFPLGATLTGVSIPYLVTFEVTAAPNLRFAVYEYGTRIFSASSDSGAGDYDPNFGWDPLVQRVRFNLVGSSVVIQKGDVSGSGYTSIVKGSTSTEGLFPMHGIAASVKVNFGTSSVEGSFITTYPSPATIYSVAQQVKDFGSAQTSVKVRVYQVSAIVGRGDYVEGTI